MQIEYSPNTGGMFRSTLRSMAADDSIEGLVLFVTPDVDLSELDSVLRELPVPVFGGTFPEVLYGNENTDEGALAIGLPVEPSVITIHDLSDPDADYTEQLNEDPLGGETAFVFVDAYSDGIERFVDALFRTYGVGFNYLGGGAGTLDMEQQPCLFTNGGILEDAAIVATVDLESTIGVRHGWQEIAGPFRVTKSSGRILETLEDEPAFEIYSQAVESSSGRTPTEDDFFEVAKSHPFGISRMDGEKIVRDPFEVNSDGALACFGEVPEDEFVHIMRGEPEHLIEAAGRARDDTERVDTEPAATFFFDCVSRVLYLEDEFDEELAAVADGELPMAGALTIGEIANDGEGHLDYYNKTAVVGRVEGV